MIIDALVLHNFGLFRGRHEIILTPPSLSKPVILIGGLNGRGKTTILDAIQLALYGKRAQCSNRESLAYRDYLKRCVHHGERSSAVEIHLTTRTEGKESTLSVRRSWTSAATTGESLTLLRDGQRDEALEEFWDEHVEQLLPAGIAPLFFFDGEKIEQLADPATSREILTTAINSLLGLDSVERLSTALRTIERQKRKELGDDRENIELDELEAEINQLSGRVDGLQHDLKDAQKLARKATATEERAEERLRKEGGERELTQKRILLKQERGELDTQIRSANERLVDLAAGDAPLLLIEPLLRAVSDQANLEAAATFNDSIQQLLEERDRETVNFLTGTKLAEHSNPAPLEEYLREDRLKRNESAAAEIFLEMPEDARQALNSVLSHEASNLRRELVSSISTEEQLREKRGLVDGRLEAIPPEKAVAHLERGRKEAAAAAEQAQGAVGAIRALLQDSTRALEQAAKSRRTVLAKDVSDRFEKDSTRRIHDYSQRTRNVLESFASALVRRNSNKISALVLDSLHQLLGKPELIGGVQLDPDTFDVALQDYSGAPLSTDRLSAGERQLLAVSILWGLARLSGRSLPAVIDTPLGRLDSTHRTNLVQSYFPRASHQVVLLSTDEEISKRYLRMIKPSVGRSYLLTYDEESHSSSVETGYFW